MNFELTPQQKAVQQSARQFAQTVLQETVLEDDAAGRFPEEAYKKMGEMGFVGLPFPKEYGGQGGDYLSYVLALEEISKINSSVGIAYSVCTSLYSGALINDGNEEQKKKYLPEVLSGKKMGSFCLTEPDAGSDAAGCKTTAIWNGKEYILNGLKCFITNGGIASFYCITAMTDKTKGVKGISMFLVDAGTPGLSTGNEENKMGIRTSNTCDVVLEDCRIPAANLVGEEGRGFSIAMKTLDQARAWMGCVATGIAQRGINEGIAYAKERVQFGKPVIKNQAMQFKVADMEIKTETARQMVAHALTKMDMGLPHSKEAAIAKCYASDIAMEVASEAIQMFGGYGYSREYPVEKLLRDDKIFQIFEGSNEIQRIVVANNTIGR